MGKPTIRFEGYTDDWEQRKLSEISDVRDGTHDSPSYLNDGHPFVTSKNVKDGYINYDDIKYISDEDFEAINKRSKVDVNDILMGMIGTIGNLALIRTEPDFAIKNVALIKDTKQVSYMYLYHYLQSSSTERQLLSGLDGGTQKFVSLKNIRELNIMVPSEAEQLKVGNFIESLDHLITLHQRKCEETKKLKKFMLQKMFPQKGEKVPKIRFDGFTDDWEQRKLGELAEIVGGGTPSTGMDSYWDGDIDWYAPAEIGEQIYLESSQRKITEEGLNKSSAKILPLGTVLFTSRAGIGKSAILLKEGCTNQGFQSIVPNKEKLDSYFIFTRSEELKEYGEKVGAGSTFVEVSGKQMANMDLMMPKTMSEQQQIGEYFQTIDHLITLYQRKCEELQNIKKFMLQNMFV